MSLASAALVSAESILALTPIAIKKTPLDPISAIWSRVLSTAALGYLLTGDRTLPKGEWAGFAALGGTNLLHIASSYESFRNLQAGQAMSLLYTYPLWNLVFGSLFGGEKIRGRDFGFMAIAAAGSILLNMDPGTTAGAESTPGRKPDTAWGIFTGLIMALSESGMHTILRGLGWKDPAKSVWAVNSSAALWLGGALGFQHLLGDRDPKLGLRSGTWLDAAWLTAFHGVSMFSGYWLRFYAVPRLSVVTYSILSYAGLLAAYLFGLIFLGERPGWMSLIGAAMIGISGLLLQTGPKKEEEQKQS